MVDPYKVPESNLFGDTEHDRFFGFSIIAFLAYFLTFSVLMVVMYNSGYYEKLQLNIKVLSEIIITLLLPLLIGSLFGVVAKFIFKVEYLKAFAKITNFVNWLISFSVLSFLLLAQILPMLRAA